MILHNTNFIIKDIVQLIIVLIVFFYSEIGSASVINVPTDFNSIQEGIDAAQNGDTVLVNTGVYYENINFKGKNIVVTSLQIFEQDTSIISQTVIDGDFKSSVVSFNNNEDTTAVLNGFTLRNGRGNGEGGGIVISSASPKLTNLIITNNDSGRGDYRPGWGGGIYAYYVDHFYLENSIVKNNLSHYQGGGIYCHPKKSFYMNNVQIINNTAGDGGGLLYWSFINESGRNIIKNSVIAYNQGCCSNDGLWIEHSDIDLINVTFFDNDITVVGTKSRLRNIEILNSILWKSNIEIKGYPNPGAKISIAHSNIDLYNTNYQDYVDSTFIYWLPGNIERLPRFKDEFKGDFRLQEDSPCIDAGVENTSFIYNNDQDTLKVPILPFSGLAPDMGAYEYNSQTNSEKPSTFILNQNYPNPCNNYTTIEFLVKETNWVTLKIYNLLGQEITTLISEKMNQGDYQFIWDVNSLSSGIYYYRIINGQNSEVKKMIVLR